MDGGARTPDEGAKASKGALSIHGTNPQYLIEKVIRSRIYDSLYWKEHCFALDAATVIDNAVKLNSIGGTYSNQRPTEFMCLVLKLLQLQPEREIILEYLRAEEFKYLRALAAFYVRLTFDPVNVYEVLEPLLDDYRKIRTRAMDGSYSIITMDEFADQLLTEERVCEIQLPRITQRKVLEETEGLPVRKSKLGKAMGVLGAEAGGASDDDDEEDEEGRERYLSRSPSGSRSPTPEREKSPEFWTEGSESESGEEEEDRTGRYISRSPDGSDRFVSRSPSPGSPVRMAVDDDERIEGDV
ncbi:pre-mRNA-splicing factor 38A [Pseudohyphozyma bogoriensis]|nr:pre-mRNA-splicing factor 38A [Pseudohyphozyma bogoriensis]